MFDAIAPRYDLVNRVMTFGMDVGWRRKAVSGLNLPRGSFVPDIACGTGDFCRELMRWGYRTAGFDMSAGMLKKAKTHAPLILADALALPLGNACADGLTCGFALRNVTDLGRLFAEFARVTRPGGRIALLEVAQPQSRMLRAGHRLYFHRVVPLIGGVLSDANAYRYLPRSTGYLPPPDQMLKMLEGEGFICVERKLLALGAAQLIQATRR